MRKARCLSEMKYLALIQMPAAKLVWNSIYGSCSWTQITFSDYLPLNRLEQLLFIIQSPISHLNDHNFKCPDWRCELKWCFLKESDDSRLRSRTIKDSKYGANDDMNPFKSTNPESYEIDSDLGVDSKHVHLSDALETSILPRWFSVSWNQVDELCLTDIVQMNSSHVNESQMNGLQTK